LRFYLDPIFYSYAGSTSNVADHSDADGRDVDGRDVRDNDDDDSSIDSDGLPDSVKKWTVVNNKKKKRKEISPVSGDVIRKNANSSRESKRVRKSPVSGLI
jgi:hypothetical protein